MKLRKYLLVVTSLLMPFGLNHAADVPDELESTVFAGPDITPSPACLCAAPTGEVYVGVDMNGSLGKDPGKGKIIRLIDSDHDGVADSHTVFAAIDNPRGLISIGNRLFVLHTVIPADTGKLTGMHLSILKDENGDGVADGAPERLVSDVSPPKHNQDRGADHTTNGIAMGIDGWIYIATGDFGMVGAKGTDGTELTMLGGGIVRVRPDGSELEIYTHGTRNIYDVAIDPFMNLYTRGNTNDGGGWNVRFIHHIQSGEYGYPVLFKHFTGEILPALEDLGGGSGTGAIFFAEPGWPAKYTNVPMMCDWGRNQMFIHRLTTDGPSFTQVPEDFIKSKQVADVDVDGSGRMYLAAWDGAGYKGSSEKGFVERVVPKDWQYQKNSIEDVILALDQLKGDLKRGEQLYTRQGCIACHTITRDQPLKGPYMGQVGAILTRDQIAESILKPNASISQGFATVMIQTKDGTAFTGFISAETADELELRDIAGQTHKVGADTIQQRMELEMSMMPPGLANALSLQDFASLVDFLASKKE